MVSAKAETFDPKSHPISGSASGADADEFEDEDAYCQSDEENLLETSEPTDTEVAFCF